MARSASSRRWSRACIRAGLEVILDVVYNHTAEGNQLGPTLRLRGIDNATYYRPCRDDPRYYVDYTGCGNTLNVQHPRVLQLIMDSLRYWVLEMHVDGFRFDLASALARELHEVDKLGAFFDIIHQDPVLSQVKLIAEPWDLGEGGYQVGNFPVGWTEWNGKYRDTMRRFWKGDGGVVSEMATRLAGSSDLYGRSGRRPYASINFITAHDGFTLHDLVSYNEKHNEANRRGQPRRREQQQQLELRRRRTHRRPGGAGPAGAPDEELHRHADAFAGRPHALWRRRNWPHADPATTMPTARTTRVSWTDWNLTPEKQNLLEFTRHMIALRKSQPVLRRRQFLEGRKIRGAEVKDISWYEPSGEEMSDEAWDLHFVRSIAVLLSGDYMAELDENGDRQQGDTLFLLFNAHHESISFHFPKVNSDGRWERLLDTSDARWARRYTPRDSIYKLKDRAVAVFRLKTPEL